MYISFNLATVVSKVLDRLLEKQLTKHDAQFAFMPGSSAETANHVTQADCSILTQTEIYQEHSISIITML